MDRKDTAQLIAIGIIGLTVVTVASVDSIKTHRKEKLKRKLMADLTTRTNAAYAVADTPAKIRLVSKLFREELDAIVNIK